MVNKAEGSPRAWSSQPRADSPENPCVSTDLWKEDQSPGTVVSRVRQQTLPGASEVPKALLALVLGPGLQSWENTPPHLCSSVTAAQGVDRAPGVTLGATCLLLGSFCSQWWDGHRQHHPAGETKAHSHTQDTALSQPGLRGQG